MNKQKGFTVVLLIAIIVVIAGIGVFAFTRISKSKNNSAVTPLTSITTPYYSISDIEQIGPYSTNTVLAGYTHNGLDFMSKKDLVEYRSLTAGKVTKAELFYESSRTDTHPQVNVMVEYDKNTIVVYTFEPYTMDMEVTKKQLSLLTVKPGDIITAGQSLGKLIKTAPQSHVHVQITRNNKELCIAGLFTAAEQAEMTAIAAVAPNVPRQLCYE